METVIVKAASVCPSAAPELSPPLNQQVKRSRSHFPPAINLLASPRAADPNIKMIGWRCNVSSVL